MHNTPQGSAMRFFNGRAVRRLTLWLALASSALAQTPLVEFRPSDPTAAAFFGTDLAVSASTVVVGVPFDAVNGPQSGSAYLFDRLTGVQRAKLVPSDGAPWAYFGESVAVAEPYVLVGCQRDAATGVTTGAAYVFDAPSGQFLRKLAPSDPGTNHQFGASVALQGTTALVGALRPNPGEAGAAYVFDVTTGQELHKLTVPGAQFDDHFGASVALEGNLAFVGATLDDLTGVSAGTVWVFALPSGNLIGHFAAPDAAHGDEFSSDLAVDGSLLVVGAPGDDDNGDGSGSAYIFDLSTFSLLTKLLPHDVGTSERFGGSVDISGTQAIVGARFDSIRGDMSTGSAYLFDAVSGAQQAKWLGPSPFAYYGQAVAIDGARALVSAPGISDPVPQSGAAFEYDTLSSSPGSSFCFGVACPCNNNDLQAGCSNGSLWGGMLEPYGTASIARDDLVLRAWALPPSQFGVLFMGTTQVQVPFGNGLRCAGGNVRRLRWIQNTQESGDLAYGPDLVADPAGLYGLAGLLTPGSVWHFQGWYRNPGGPCGAFFNLTNAVSVSFLP